MYKLNMVTAINRYNDIMECIGYEHNTINTPLSEGTDTWSLRDMVAECSYVLSTYFEDGHCNCDMRYSDDIDERKTWLSETGRLKRFINRYEPYIKSMECSEGHCSKYD